MNISKYIKKMFINLQDQDFFCPVCNNKVKAFLPLAEKFRTKIIINDKEYYLHQQCETLNAEAYECPNCHASDRERLYAIYLKKFFLNTKNTAFNVIHFAPEVSLRKFLTKCKLERYTTADLFMKNVDDKADLTNLNIYKDNCFDLVICSHILEHITDDKQAMKEIYRILKPKGKGILMVPILNDLDTIYEDVSIITEQDRLLHFGQDDHVRIYNKDGFIRRLSDCGFNVVEYGVTEFSLELFTQMGIAQKSILYIVEK